MPAIIDFRTLAFDPVRVTASGKDVGRRVYWKLYAIENVIRVLIHSVLTVQIGTNWWTTAVDQVIQRRVQRFRNDYARRPWHSSPGRHDIYYTQLSDLSEIIRANSHLFLPIVPDIDQWVLRIEQTRLPRNIVGHMNWPSQADRQRIDVFYSDFLALTNQLHNSGLVLTVP